MTALMISMIVIAYIVLWYLVLKCTKMINKTSDDGQTSRDIINQQKL